MRSLIILTLAILTFFLLYNSVGQITNTDSSTELKAVPYFENEYAVPFSTRKILISKNEIKYSLEIPKSSQNRYLYFQNTSGNIKIYTQENKLIYQSENRPFLLSSLNELHLKLEEGYQSLTFVIDVQNSESRVISLTKPYLITQEKLEALLMRHEFFYNSLRNGILISEVMLFISFIMLFCVGYVKWEAIPLIVIFGFLSILSFSQTEYGTGLHSTYQRYLISFTPMLGVGVFCLGMTSKEVVKQTRKFILAILLCSIVHLIIYFNIIDSSTLHLFINIPIFLLFSLVRVIKGIRFITPESKMRESFLMYSIIIIVLAVLFDTLSWAGVIELHDRLTQLSLILFVFSTALYFSSTQFDLKIRAEKSENNILIELEDQRLRLEKKSHQINLLQLDKQKKELLSKISNDLHDGLLSYLHLILIISESSHTKNSAEIQKLTTRSIQELRMMILQETVESFSLKSFINFIDNLLIEPLNFTGVNAQIDQTNVLPEHYDLSIPTLQVFRIIQEALYNAVSRAGAKKIRIRFMVSEENSVTIIVINTEGKDYIDSPVKGRGIENMINRSNQLGANFNINSIETGAVVTLKLN